MEIELDITKSVDENASVYFEKAKKAKKKIEGAKMALAKSVQKIVTRERNMEDDMDAHEKKINKKKIVIKREWYEKFKWFFSSEDFLCIAGTDATTNEIVIKKHTIPGDVVFHTDMSGSPFTIVKAEGKEPGEMTLDEAAQFTAIYSRAWKQGLATLDVFHCNPDQVSKTPNPGEYLGKGSFVIRGKLHYHHPKIEVAIGIHEGKIIGGPESAVKAHTDSYVILIQGRDKTSDTAKKIKKLLGGGEHDDIMKFIPAGGASIKKR